MSFICVSMFKMITLFKNSIEYQNDLLEFIHIHIFFTFLFFWYFQYTLKINLSQFSLYHCIKSEISTAYWQYSILNKIWREKKYSVFNIFPFVFLVEISARKLIKNYLNRNRENKGNRMWFLPSNLNSKMLLKNMRNTFFTDFLFCI